MPRGHGAPPEVAGAVALGATVRIDFAEVLVKSSNGSEPDCATEFSNEICFSNVPRFGMGRNQGINTGSVSPLSKEAAWCIGALEDGVKETCPGRGMKIGTLDVLVDIWGKAPRRVRYLEERRLERQRKYKASTSCTKNSKA